MKRFLASLVLVICFVFVAVFEFLTAPLTEKTLPILNESSVKIFIDIVRGAAGLSLFAFMIIPATYGAKLTIALSDLIWPAKDGKRFLIFSAAITSVTAIYTFGVTAFHGLELYCYFTLIYCVVMCLLSSGFDKTMHYNMEYTGLR